jgi:hypothetical protein
MRLTPEEVRDLDAIADRDDEFVDEFRISQIEEFGQPEIDQPETVPEEDSAKIEPANQTVAENPLEQMASQERSSTSEQTSAIDDWGRTLQLGRTGSLKVFLGPMFAGKSSRLLEATNSNSAVSRTVIEVNHVSDDRYTTEGTVTTHSGLSSTWGNTVP